MPLPWISLYRSVRRLRRTAGRSRIIAPLAAMLCTLAVVVSAASIFGPRTYRGTGRPVVSRERFTAPAAGGGYTLRVTNDGVHHAMIVINGRLILRPSDFRDPPDRDGRDDDRWEPEWDRAQRDWREDRRDRTRDLIEKPIKLQKGANDIVVAFIGHRGTSFTVEIVRSGDTTPPVITTSLNPVPNAAGWNRTNVVVTFTCTDAGSGVETCPPPATVTTEGAAQVVSGTAVDKAGNTATASVTLKVDKTPPAVSAAAAPAPNANGWNNTPVTVTFTVVDALSGIAPGTLTAPVTLTAQGANLSASGQATDRAGNTGSITKNGINIDQVKPTIGVSLSPAPNANGVVIAPVTAHFTCADSGSGIATCPADQVFSAPGANQTATGTATDEAGNTASVTSQAFTILAGTPTITVTLSPPPNSNGWRNRPVTAHFTCMENAAPLAGCPADTVVSTEGAGQTVTGSVTDLAGTTASVTSDPFSIDLTRPSVNLSLSPAASGAGNWFNTPVIVHAACSDALSGIADCPADQVLGQDGANQSASASTTDRAGNTQTVTSTGINIDTAPPAIAVTLAPLPNENGWNNTPVTAHFVCSDATSGVAMCPSDSVLASEGSLQTISGNAADVAGNIGAAAATVNIDTTPPTIALSSPTTGNNGTTVYTPSVTVSGTLSDSGSGLATAACNGVPATITAGALSCVVALVPGSNTVQAVATDRAGNPASASLTFTYLRAPMVTINAPSNLSYTSITPTTVSGTVDDPGATVTINSIAAPVVNGSFSVALPLAEGPNLLTATATTATGATGTASLTVTLDTTPPHVTITSPPDGFITTDGSIAVSGSINDIVVGTVNSEQARVTVAGQMAQVANRTFLAATIPLSIGDNVIQAVGSDRVGNSATSQIVVHRRAPTSQAKVQLVSGNNQSAAIGALAPNPLVVALTDSSGQPAAGKTVIFKVTQNNGVVATDGAAAPSAVVTTDPQGRAQARWTLGQRAGAGGNILEAYSVGFDGTALFTATGTLGAAGKIVVDTGNDQIGPIGQTLPRPFVAVVVDDGNNRRGNVPVTFAVKEGGGLFDGQPSVTVVSDPDGRVAATLTLGMQEGNANNLASATFEGNEGFSANFTASGRAPGNPVNTTISGVVLDNSNQPIPGVTIRAVATHSLHASLAAVAAAPTVQTNGEGQFTITPAPVGFVKLVVDGSTAQLPGSYPSLEYDLVTVAGNVNNVGQPIYLLPLNTANKLCVSATTGGGTLTIPEAPGFSLTFGPGQVTFPGGSKEGCVSVTVVHGDKVPMVPGFGQQPQFIVTIQPSGAAFNPPAPITLPNVDGLAPRSVTEMYSFDHDIGSFVAIGTGIVSDDGQIIRSAPGTGVLKAGWHCGGNPNGTGAAATCPLCNTCVKENCTADNSQIPPQSSPNDCKKEVCQGGGVASVPNDSEDVLRFSPKQKKNVVDECQLCQGGNPQAGPNGIKCDDEDLATVNDKCDQGTCKGDRIQVRFTRIWSGQFNNEVNFLPGGAGNNAAKSINPYILMAASDVNARTSLQGAFTVTPDTPEARGRLIAATRDKSSGTILNFGTISGDTISASAATFSINDYAIVIGIDLDGDGLLTSNELLRKSDDDVGFFRVVGPISYDADRAILTGGVAKLSLQGFFHTARLLNFFANDILPAGPGIGAASEPLDATNPSLSHVVGAIWSASRSAAVPAIHFQQSDPIVDALMTSPEFQESLTNTIKAHEKEVKDFFAFPPGSDLQSSLFSWDIVGTSGQLIQFTTPGSDLTLAISTGTILGKIAVTVARDSNNGFVVTGISAVNVSVKDLYDFDYDSGTGLGVIGIAIHSAAELQAGYGTLGQVGHVFWTYIDVAGPLTVFPVLHF